MLLLDSKKLIAAAALVTSVGVMSCATTPSAVDDNGAAAGGSAGDARDGATSNANGGAFDPSDAGAGATGTTGTPADAEPCGIRSGMRGLTQRKVTAAGLARTYLVYLPPSLSATTPAPFVYVFHGYTMSGQEMHDITAYETIADREGVAVVFPDGQGGPGSTSYPWNVENKGQTVCGNGEGVNATGDDFAFMDAMKSDVATDQCLDANHTFVTGFSMGGYFSHHVACYRSDVRAVAPHSGGTIADLSACTTGHVPMIVFHGAADSVIAAGCDDPHVAAEQGFSASASLWAQKNGCKTTATTIETDGTGGGKGQCWLYDGCPADGQVELCAFAGMDHCWAGGNAKGAGGSSACPTFASATELEWAFWKKYAW